MPYRVAISPANVRVAEGLYLSVLVTGPIAEPVGVGSYLECHCEFYLHRHRR